MGEIYFVGNCPVKVQIFLIGFDVKSEPVERHGGGSAQDEGVGIFPVGIAYALVYDAEIVGLSGDELCLRDG